MTGLPRRSHASLFDVYHMLGVTFSGKDAVEFVEKMVVADVKGLADNTGCYSLFTNEKGGIVDDTGDHRRVQSLQGLPTLCST